jgi:hypothetical protein
MTASTFSTKSWNYLRPKSTSLAHWVKEKDLMEELEDWEDVEIFDARNRETGAIPLEIALRKLNQRQ